MIVCLLCKLNQPKVVPHTWQTCFRSPFSLGVRSYTAHLNHLQATNNHLHQPQLFSLSFTTCMLVSRLCLVLRAEKDRRLLRQSGEESGLKKPQGLLGIWLGCGMWSFFFLGEFMNLCFFYCWKSMEIIYLLQFF